MVLHNFEELISSIGKLEKRRTAVVVCADDPVTLEAVMNCRDKGLINPILVGESGKIETLLKDFGMNLEEIEVINETNPEEAAKTGVRLVREAKANFLMKGKLETSTLLKAVVAKDTGLGTGRLMSHLAFLEIPNYHKLVVLTDSGMVIRPSFEQKIEIINNAVDTLSVMGYRKPKIGFLTAVEKENPKMPETIEAAELVKLNRKGGIGDCYLEGPVSYDILMNRDSAKKKGFSSPVVGDADILFVADMATGNILGKALSVSAEAKMAGIIVGASVPIALTSRGAQVEEKINSMLLAAYCCR